MELVRQYRGSEIDLHIQRRGTEYVQPKAKPFSGHGQRLGEIVTPITGGGTVGVKYGQGQASSSSSGSRISGWLFKSFLIS